MVHIEVVRFYVVKTGFFPSIKSKTQIERWIEGYSALNFKETASSGFSQINEKF